MAASTLRWTVRGSPHSKADVVFSIRTPCRSGIGNGPNPVRLRQYRFLGGSSGQAPPPLQSPGSEWCPEGRATQGPAACPATIPTLRHQLLQTALFVFQILVLFPIIIIETHYFWAIPLAITIDFVMTSAITLASSVVIKRWALIGVLPYYYFLRFTEVFLYFTAFTEIIILRKSKSAATGSRT